MGGPLAVTSGFGGDKLRQAPTVDNWKYLATMGDMGR